MKDNNLKKVPYALVIGILNSAKPVFTRIEGTTVTMCHLVTDSGFVLGSGESCCLNPADFVQEYGEEAAEKNARINAENNVWHGEGYARAMGYVN